ncbi:MAG TPA: hypothetical protein VGX26_00885 [Solirubrobacteraceae bacterium]|jgi:hypothetical protein|nr:hypothetical protein [Solirubrobacteraceae bacterium]
MGDTEEVDALPVLADEPAVLETSAARALPGDRGTGRAVVPAAQAAAVAAGGFVAGAAVVGLVNRRRHRRVRALAKRGRAGRRLSRDARSGGKAGELLQIVGSRSLLVDVHLLGGRD